MEPESSLPYSQAHGYKLLATVLFKIIIIQ